LLAAGRSAAASGEPFAVGPDVLPGVTVEVIGTSLGRKHLCV
jgi:hypothetical protein